MGHIAPETAKQMVSNGVVEGIEVDLTTMAQACDSCEYAKATQKPIKKVREAPQAANFGDEIHSDVWGPLPGPSSTTQFQPSRYYNLIEEANTWENLSACIYSHKEQQGNSLYMIHLNITDF